MLSLIIQYMNKTHPLKDDKLTRIIAIIRSEVHGTEEMKFLHFIRTLDKEENQHANLASRLQEGRIIEDGVPFYAHIP